MRDSYDYYYELLRFNLRSKVYHYDAKDAVSQCAASGDPHVITFDGVYFSTYSTGTFIYSQSLNGLPLEVRIAFFCIDVL
jgi:hypothetical protein